MRLRCGTYLSGGTDGSESVGAAGEHLLAGEEQDTDVVLALLLRGAEERMKGRERKRKREENGERVMERGQERKKRTEEENSSRWRKR